MAHRLRKLLFSRTSLKCYLITATLICLTYTSLRWYGRRAWEAEKERAAKAGMAADFAALSQPMPPEEDNFLAAPVFGDWNNINSDSNTDKFQMWFSKRVYVSPPKGKNKTSRVPFPEIPTLTNWCDYFRLTGMLPVTPTQNSPAAELVGDQRWKPIFDAVYEASKRKTSRIPLSGYAANRFAISDQRIPLLLSSLILYARAQLELGNLSEALPALRVLSHLSNAAIAGNGPIYELPGTKENQISLLKSGILMHRWPESTLQQLLAENHPEALQNRCQAIFRQIRLDTLTIFQNFPESVSGPISIRAEPMRALYYKYVIPDFFVTQCMIQNSQWYGTMHEAGAPLGQDETWSSRLQMLAQAPRRGLGWRVIVGGGGPEWSPQAEFYFSYLRSLLHASIRHLAIASELFYLKQSRYPKSLEELSQAVPLPTIAMKDTDGQPIRYSTDKEGTWFTLRSVAYSPMPKARWTPTFESHITFSTDPDSQPK